jgi:hypothetical protein
VALVWLAGLGAGFFALLSAAAKYGCGGSDDGLACHTSGSLLGALLVLVVIAVVTAVTVLSDRRPPRDVLILGVTGLVALAICLVAARMLLDTV